MAKFRVDTNFQFGGAIRVAESFLIVDDAAVITEIKKGIHEVTKKPISGLLNHCSPANEKTARLLKKGKIEKEIVEDPKDEDIEDEESEDDVGEEQIDLPTDIEDNEIERLYAIFEAKGFAYDKRWKVARLKDELKKKQKETGK